MQLILSVRIRAYLHRLLHRGNACQGRHTSWKKCVHPSTGGNGNRSLTSREISLLSPPELCRGNACQGRTTSAGISVRNGVRHCVGETDWPRLISVRINALLHQELHRACARQGRMFGRDVTDFIYPHLPRSPLPTPPLCPRQMQAVPTPAEFCAK